MSRSLSAIAAILTALPDQDIRRIVKETSNRLSAYGASASAILNAVRSTRALGYSSGYVYGVSAVIAVGSPILDDDGEPIAALSIAAVETRMSKTRQRTLADLLRHEASHLHAMMADGRVVTARA